MSRWTASLQHPILQAVSIDPDDGFSPDEIALLSVVTNPSLRTARDSRGIAHAQVIAAGLLPNPTVGFQSYVPVTGNTTGSVVGYSGQLAWSIDQLFVQGAQVNAAELAEQSVALDIVWSEWQVAMQAQLLAYQIILLQMAQKINTTNIAQIEDTLSHIRHAASIGNATGAQLTSTESALSQAQTASATTNRDLAVRLQQLKGILGGLEGVVEHLTSTIPHSPDLVNVTQNTLSAELPERRADLQAMHVAMQSQNAAFEAATRRAFPSIQFGLQIARDSGDFVALSPSIQIGLPVFDHGQVGRSAARAQTERLGDLFAERLNQARQRLGVALADVRSTETLLLILDRAIVRQEAVVELYDEARIRGSVDILVFYAARSTLVQLRLQRVSEQMRFWQAVVQLRTESGNFRLPSESIEQGGPSAP